MELDVNGIKHTVDVDADTPLLWVLREQLALTGTKYSCGIGECGACTVLVDDEAELACQMSVADAEGSAVVTIEGLAGPVADRVRVAWWLEQVPQCGYCQPAQILTATSLLTDTPKPSRGEIDATMSSVLCRCGAYPDIRRAIERAADDGSEP